MKKTVLFIFLIVTIVVIFAGNKRIFAASRDNLLLDSGQYTNMNESSNELLEMEVDSFKVTFYLDGGTVNGFTNIPEQTVLLGDLVADPGTPKKDFSDTFWNQGSLTYEPITKDYIFKGWLVSGLGDTKYWDFNSDVVEEDTLLWADWEWPTNYEQILVSNFYIQGKYWQNWDYFTRQKYVSVDQIVGGRPVEIGGDISNPYTSMSINGGELYQAKTASGISSTYGGCGPIALIGMFDFLAKYRGYTNLLPDPNSTNDRVQLATDVFTLSRTIEVSWAGGNKSTFMSPAWFVEGAENVLTNAGYSDSFNLSITINHNLMKQSIDKGIPVFIWTASLGGEGYLDYHWITVYGYEEWRITDNQGYVEETTMFIIRTNWGNPQDSWEYMDADLISGLFTFWGAVIFEEVFTEQTIYQSDYGFDSQYFFYEIQKQISLTNGYIFNTKRLRTGYVYSYDYLGNVNGRFLVMSANRLNAGTAFLEYTFNQGIRGIKFDISLWSSSEGLALNTSSIRLEMKINGNWEVKQNFDILTISKNRNDRDTYLLYFDNQVTDIRFIVQTSYPTSNSNKGRVVLGNVTILY